MALWRFSLVVVAFFPVVPAYKFVACYFGSFVLAAIILGF
jgi:hypothetical protein